MSVGSHNVGEINSVSGKRTKIGLILIGLSGVYPYVIVTCGSWRVVGSFSALSLVLIWIESPIAD